MSNKVYMATIPHSGMTKKAFFKMIRNFDIHKWIYAVERGRGGYKHIQCRFRTNKSFEEIRRALICGHIEEASDTWEYEKKDGNYMTSDDNHEILKLRYGKLTKVQEWALVLLESTNDREVVVWVDKDGNSGKTWLTAHLWERGQACYCPPTLSTPKELISWVHSAYNHEPYIIIDVPRTWKWDDALYTAIETIKDGLVYDPRYSAHMRNIRGVKVMCMTNTEPKTSKLSEDRWVMYRPSNLFETAELRNSRGGHPPVSHQGCETPPRSGKRGTKGRGPSS